MSEAFDATAYNDRARALYRKAFPTQPTRIYRKPQTIMVVVPPKAVTLLPEPEPEPMPFKRDILDLQSVPEALRAKLSAKVIVADIAKRHDVPIELVFGHCRNKRIVDARHEAVIAVRKAFPLWSLPQMGRFFNRDHTTILHALRKHGVL